MKAFCLVIGNAALTAALALTPALTKAQEMILHLPLDSIGESGSFVVNDNGAAAPERVPGKIGTAMHFQGKSAVALPFDFNFKLYPQVTVTAWVRQDEGASNSRAILSSASPKGLSLSVNGGSATLVPGTGGLSYPGRMPFNQWVFIAGVVDMSTGTALLYRDDGPAVVKDGILLVTDDASKYGDPTDTGAPKQPFLIVGADKFSPWLSADRSMAIDDVRLYTGVLTREQIDAIRNSSTAAEAAHPENIGETEKNDTGSDGSAASGTNVTTPTGTVGIPGAAEQITRSADDALPDAPRSTVTSPTGKVAIPAAAEAIETSQKIALPDAPPATGGDHVAPQPSQATASPGGDFYPAGPETITAVSGVNGNIVKRLDLSSFNAFVSEIVWSEVSNRPCRLIIQGAQLLDGNVAGQPVERQAEFGCSLGTIFDGSSRSVATNSTWPVNSLLVCNNESSSRLKGLRINGKNIAELDTMSYQPGDLSDTEQLPNCTTGGWSKVTANCPVGQRATGVMIHAQDAGGDEKAEIVGLALICRAVTRR